MTAPWFVDLCLKVSLDLNFNLLEYFDIGGFFDTGEPCVVPWGDVRRTTEMSPETSLSVLLLSAVLSTRSCKRGRTCVPE